MSTLSDKKQGHRSKRGKISTHITSVTDTAQSRCECSDGKSIFVIQGMTLHACSQARRRGQAACADFKFPIRIRPERAVCVSCLRVVCQFVSTEKAIFTSWLHLF